MKITNPATGEIIREIEEDTSESIASKFARARKAQKEWAARPASERKASVLAFRDQMKARSDELARILTQEVGKPLSQSRNEIKGTFGRIDFFLENFESATRDEVVHQEADGSLVEKIVYEPLGVVANISAWNYPYFVGTNVFIPALLTGNSVLYKPSEYATLTGLAIGEMMRAAGIPDGVFTLVVGGGGVGADLIRQPVNGVFFTGSYATGKRIADSTASRMIRTQLELGGKDPIYVCEDVDVSKVAEGVADGAFYNAGQSCCSVERIYVHTQIYDRFMDAFVRTVKGFVVGDPMDENTYIGPLTREAQILVLERQIADARAKGAKVLLGGKRSTRGGSYFEPTVLVDVDSRMEIMREESFGPVIGIQRVANDEEAIRLMNDTEYGLTAGVYTRNSERADALLSRVQAGSAYWNCCDRVSPRLPWTGRGHSGIGSTLSTHGIRAFTQFKAHHKRCPPPF